MRIPPLQNRAETCKKGNCTVILGVAGALSDLEHGFSNRVLDHAHVFRKGDSFRKCIDKHTSKYLFVQLWSIETELGMQNVAYIPYDPY